ncbi:response regulator transcription factor [Arenibacterium halophilum]|uniref:Response regulator transcription factor n=1 Tax=Arenibacterium halophilum TaxID=2583821 RepID=A0ABY2XEX0_9RHOB|nr:response regulator transcription factor [Arenibacterium halophilum]TMV15012.1 response regulator transcription factor [Arenibacterium halophilum]
MRILLADDHGLVRETIAMFLQGAGVGEVVCAEDLDGALVETRTRDGFDLVLLDYEMPGMNGLTGLSRMKSAVGDCPVAILSGTATATMAADSIAAGAAGFVPKTLASRSMVSAIRFMAAGEVYVPHDLMVQGDDAAPDLTERETSVLRGLCEGKSNKEIARDLGLQEVTIKLHVKTLCRKLEARNRTQAAMIARDRRIF